MQQKAFLLLLSLSFILVSYEQVTVLGPDEIINKIKETEDGSK